MAHARSASGEVFGATMTSPSCASRAGHALRTLNSLETHVALDALRPLRAGRTRCAGVTLIAFVAFARSARPR